MLASTRMPIASRIEYQERCIAQTGPPVVAGSHLPMAHCSPLQCPTPAPQLQRNTTAPPMADEKTVTFPVEATHIMMFRRSIGDYSVPDTGMSDAAAPPTFLRAAAQFDPDYFLRPKPGEDWLGSGRNPSGVTGKPASSGGLHAEQHFEFERPIRPGDVLQATQKDGRTWEKESKRAGKLVFLERITQYHDASGALVCTARAISVRTERPVDQQRT